VLAGGVCGVGLCGVGCGGFGFFLGGMWLGVFWFGSWGFCSGCLCSRGLGVVLFLSFFDFLFLFASRGLDRLVLGQCKVVFFFLFFFSAGWYCAGLH